MNPFIHISYINLEILKLKTNLKAIKKLNASHNFF